MKASDPTELAARVNAVAVSAEDLLRVAAVVHRLDPERRDWRAQALCARRLFGNDREKALAVTVRLEAMTRLISAGSVPEPFAGETPHGIPVLAESVFQAAAAERLLGDAAGCRFDADAFLDCVVKHANLDRGE